MHPLVKIVSILCLLAADHCSGHYLALEGDV